MRGRVRRGAGRSELRRAPPQSAPGQAATLCRVGSATARPHPVLTAPRPPLQTREHVRQQTACLRAAFRKRFEDEVRQECRGANECAETLRQSAHLLASAWYMVAAEHGAAVGGSSLPWVVAAVLVDIKKAARRQVDRTNDWPDEGKATSRD